MAIVRRALSASTNGQAVVLTTGTAPVTIHTSTTAANTSDEAHLWVANTAASAVTITVFVGTTGSGNQIIYEIASHDGLHLVLPGVFLASGLAIYGRSDASAVPSFGFVNRLTTGA